MPIKAILFDIDGTLVDSNDQHVLAWEEAFRREGLVLDRQAIHDQIGKGADNLVPTLMPGANEADAERLGEVHGEIFKERYLADIRPFPMARELLLRSHDAGRTLVLASSASTEELNHYLDLLHARDLITASTSADDVEHTKPAPDIFATALGKIAPITGDEALGVGDTPYDVQAAGKCRIATVALRSGKFGDDALRGAGAIALYDDVAALLAGFETSPLNR